MDEVVLVQQPSSGHIVRNKPHHLTCKAINAKKIRFKCNEKWLDENRYESVLGTDTNSQLPYMESSVEINRQEIDIAAHTGHFTCQCYASGATETNVVSSDPARIHVASHFSFLRFSTFLQTRQLVLNAASISNLPLFLV
ncbi:hypothetical protein WR25_16770 [Diploscapter pachys]|uniref:Netrin receptor UNC5A-D-like N-terminal domain-containing protein n=1 Tax=Diploscapter pachys TaxID=2018661 RepID=A0A2A2L7V0_9BILA|nr:hypothetical protein WR25_16770 [Diploscapter pachys]